MIMQQQIIKNVFTEARAFDAARLCFPGDEAVEVKHHHM